MAIAFDNAARIVGSGGSTTASGAYTVTGTNPGLYVGVINYGTGSTTDVVSIVYGGQNLTRKTGIGFTTSAVPTNSLEFWYLGNPPTGSNTLTATRTSTSSNMTLVVLSYTGVAADGNPTVTATNVVDAATTISATLTPNTNEWAAVVAGSQRNLTASTNVTARAGSGNQEFSGDSNGIAVGSYTQTLNISLANAAAIIQFTVPVFAASGPTNLKSLDTNVKANIKSYNGNVIANIKSINGNS